MKNDDQQENSRDSAPFRGCFFFSWQCFAAPAATRAMRLFLSSRENTIVYSGGRNSALRLGFDNGGKEYFIPGNIPEWAAAILEARITSLTLAYTQIPPTTSAVEQGSRGCWVMAGIFAGIVLCFVCSLAGFLTFTFLLASNSQ